MTNQEISHARASLALYLRESCGLQFADIARVMRGSKEEARAWVAKGERLRREDDERGLQCQ